MDYKEKYEELVEAARAVVEGNPGLCNMNKRLGRVRDLLPEKESADERIRKAISYAICAAVHEDGTLINDVTRDKALAYLEKQKEQKPNVELIQKSWYLEGYHDGKYNNEPKWLIQTGEGGPMYEENPKYGTQNPAEWSEEDESYLQTVISEMEANKKEAREYEHKTYDTIILWLKSLRPQPYWKPSEEQVYSLGTVVKGYDNCTVGSVGYNLKELYEQLKKL